VVRSSQTCHNDIVIISNIEAFPLNALTLLVGSQEGHPARTKTEWWDAGVVICLERGADLHMAQLMPLPLTVSCFSKIQIGFTVLVPAHLGSPGHSPHRSEIMTTHHTKSSVTDGKSHNFYDLPVWHLWCLPSRKSWAYDSTILFGLGTLFRK